MRAELGFEPRTSYIQVSTQSKNSATELSSHLVETRMTYYNISLHSVQRSSSIDDEVTSRRGNKICKTNRPDICLAVPYREARTSNKHVIHLFLLYGKVVTGEPAQKRDIQLKSSVI